MLFWTTAGDDKVCDACQALAGKPDGEGWSSANPSEVDRYIRDVAGNWVYTGTPGGLKGPPPLHPNCRCKVIEQA